jgi:hypothetical protein
LALAHSLTETFHLPVSPLVAASLSAVLVYGVAMLVPQRRGGAPNGRETAEVQAWAGSLSRAQVAVRAVAVALLALAIAAGRLGADDELENLAPALVVGAGWPLLVLASVVLGPAWRWLDPWDAVARVLTRGDGDDSGERVWPAALVAVPGVWYLSAYADPLAPRSIGAALALYSIFTLAGCLARGRRRWLSTAEPLGIVLSWLALLPRGALGAWRPPRDAEALLGVLAGGVLFGAVRRSELWGDLNTDEHASLLAALGMLGFCLAGAGLLTLLRRRSRDDEGRGSVARGAVPALAGIVVAVALERSRLFTSVQLLPGLLGDPFGRGWDVLGAAGAGLDPAPLGTRGLLWVQLAVALAGHVAGALVVARGTRRGHRGTAAIGVAALAAASTIALASH